MPIQKFITAAKLDEYIRTEIDERLHTHGIHGLGHYGWLDEYTADPEFFGHAEHPLGWDFVFANTSFGKPLSRRLEPWEEFLAISYKDFHGLMEVGRLSIGLALFHGDLVKDNLFSDQSLFELHCLHSMVDLAMESDRLRDFFVAAIFRKVTEDYRKEGKYKDALRSWYTTPFREAVAILPASETATEVFPKIVEATALIWKHIKDRNDIIHEIATQSGRFEKRRVSAHSPAVPERRLSKGEQEMIATAHQSKIVAALEKPMDWYKLLVKTSSDVFVAAADSLRTHEATS